jgi:predicted TIM-barrel fold metal-dependent hydrolase
MKKPTQTAIKRGVGAQAHNGQCAQVSFSLIDSHCHVTTEGYMETGRMRVPSDPAALLATMRDAKISTSVIFDYYWQSGQIAKVRAKNDFIAQVVHSHPDVLIGFGSIHPYDGAEALDEMTRCVTALNLKGFKLHPFSQEFDVLDERVLDVCDRAHALGVPLLFDSFHLWDEGGFRHLMQLADNKPDVTFIFAHAGFDKFALLAPMGFLRQKYGWLDNVYYDLSAILVAYHNSPYSEQLAWTLRTAGVDRLLFASDWPVLSPQETLAALRTLAFTDEEMHLICYQNAVRLLGLENVHQNMNVT